MEEKILQAINNLGQNLMKEINIVKKDVTILNEKIDKVEERMTQKIEDVELRMTQKIDDVEERMTQKINDVNGKIDKLDERQNKMEKNLQDLPDSISRSVEKIFTRVDYRLQQLIKSDENKQFELLYIKRRLHRLEVANGILEPIF